MDEWMNEWVIWIGFVCSFSNAYTPPLHSIGRPAKKHAIQTPAVTRQWWSIRCGHLSVIARHNASIPPNCEPMPNINIITKNKIAHSCGNGISSTASGYAINTCIMCMEQNRKFVVNINVHQTDLNASIALNSNENSSRPWDAHTQIKNRWKPTDKRQAGSALHDFWHVNL